MPTENEKANQKSRTYTVETRFSSLSFFLLLGSLFDSLFAANERGAEVIEQRVALQTAGRVTLLMMEVAGTWFFLLLDECTKRATAALARRNVSWFCASNETRNIVHHLTSRLASTDVMLAIIETLMWTLDSVLDPQERPIDAYREAAPRVPPFVIELRSSF